MGDGRVSNAEISLECKYTGNHGIMSTAAQNVSGKIKPLSSYELRAEPFTT